MRTKLKNVLSGKVVDKTFNADVKVETANVDKRDMKYLYNDGDVFVFMDTETYDQIHVSPRDGRRRRALPAGEPGRDRRACTRATPLYVELPGLGRAARSSTPSRACRATAPPAAPSRPRSRPATRSQVPLFITTGEKVKVDTRDGSYLGRVTELTVAARTKARKRALDVLFESEQRGLPRGDDARRTGRRRARPAGQRLHGRAGRGRRGHRDEIDELIATYSAGWPLDRMPAVDRNDPADRGLRAAVTSTRCPTRSRSSEAVALARELSTDDSPAFVNGLLARLAELKPTLADQTDPSADPARSRPTSRRSRRRVLRRAEPAGLRTAPRAAARLRPSSASAPRSSTARRASASSTPQVISCSASCARRLVVDDGERAQVVLADRQHLAVVVAALRLDRRGVARQRAGPLGRSTWCSRSRSRTSRGGGSPRAPSWLRLGQQLAHRHAVEVGQLGEPLHGDGAVAALVRADDDGLPAARRTSPPRRAATAPAACGWRAAAHPSALA